MGAGMGLATGTLSSVKMLLALTALGSMVEKNSF
jgi:hypothetical protein